MGGGGLNIFLPLKGGGGVIREGIYLMGKGGGGLTEDLR